MKKILIIEDDVIVANIYRNKFSIEGFTVDIANDGMSGLEAIKTFRPDGVVLDLMLPKMTGVELMKKVRGEADFQKLPIIVFSNTYLTNMVQEAWKAGATKCLSKANCTPKQVIEVLRSTLNNGTGAAHAQANGSATAARGHQHAPTTAPTHGHTHPRTVHTPPPSETDTEFQRELLSAFLESLPATLLALRAQLKNLVKADDAE